MNVAVFKTVLYVRRV